MKTLFLDIETAPNLAYVWRFFKENVGQEQVLSPSTILSFAASWMGSDKVDCFTSRRMPEKALLGILNHYLDTADFVVAHNGQGFDLPRIRGRSLVHGLNPPAPYKVIDTWLIAKKEFGFETNSLAYLAKILGVAQKSEHKKFPGFTLWAEVLKNNSEAWEELRKYNIQDVVVLKDVYMKMRPYARNHPNTVVAEDVTEVTCPTCGSTDNQSRGYAYTNVSKFRRYRCNSCGKWHRSRFTELSKDSRKLLTTNIV